MRMSNVLEVGGEASNRLREKIITISRYCMRTWRKNCVAPAPRTRQFAGEVRQFRDEVRQFRDEEQDDCNRSSCAARVFAVTGRVLVLGNSFTIVTGGEVARHAHLFRNNNVAPRFTPFCLVSASIRGFRACRRCVLGTRGAVSTARSRCP